MKATPWEGWSPAKRLGVLVGLWTVPALLSVFLTYAAGVIRGSAGPFGQELRVLLGIFLPTWYFWVLGTPVALWLAGRFSVRTPPRWRAWGVHAAAATGLGLLHTLLVTGLELFRLVSVGAAAPIPLSTLYLSTLGRLFPFDLFIYVAIVAVGAGVAILRESQERELRASRLETELSRARLEALHMQLHPHFLFNALNSVAMLVRTGRGAEALQAVVGFGNLLRRQLDSEVEEASLTDEIAFVRDYLSLEQIRFGDDLEVVYEISDEVAPASIPSLLLQPLVENAIRHGAAQVEGRTRITLRARREGERLVVEIFNPAPVSAADAADAPREGVGLTNVRRRLEARYGAEFALSVAPVGDQVVARISIPYEVAPSSFAELREG